MLRAVVRRALDAGAARDAVLLCLDWRPMSQTVDTPRDLLPLVRLALQAVRDVDEPALAAECHRDAAAKFARTEDLNAAGAQYTSALRLHRELGDLAGESNTLRNLAVTLTTDPAERVDYARQAVELARRSVRSVLGTALSARRSAALPVDRTVCGQDGGGVMGGWSSVPIRTSGRPQWMSGRRQGLHSPWVADDLGDPADPCSVPGDRPDRLPRLWIRPARPASTPVCGR